MCSTGVPLRAYCRAASQHDTATSTLQTTRRYRGLYTQPNTPLGAHCLPSRPPTTPGVTGMPRRPSGTPATRAMFICISITQTRAIYEHRQYMSTPRPPPLEWTFFIATFVQMYILFILICMVLFHFGLHCWSSILSLYPVITSATLYILL